MNKWYLAAGAAAGGLASLLIVRRYQKRHADKPSSLELAGIPDQVAEKNDTEPENAKMVSEGSQFGVHYYNEVLEEQEDMAGK